MIVIGSQLSVTQQQPDKEKILKKSIIGFIELFVLSAIFVSTSLGETVPKFSLERFYCGFYTYSLDEETAKKMSEAGFNAAYVVGGLRQEKKARWQHTEKEFIGILALAKKYRLKLVVQGQGDLEYLHAGHTEKAIKELLVPRAVAFLKKYANEPEFIAYCVKEEPRPEMLDKLRLYYTELRKAAPSVPLYIINNRGDSAAQLGEPWPEILGHDSYPFFWGWNTYGHVGLNSPRLAFYWYQRRCSSFEKISREHSRPMVTVFTGQPVWGGVLDLNAKKASRGVRVCKDEKQLELIKLFVKQRRAGWKMNDEGTRIIHPGWYRAPKNCTRAMAWIAVMEGSKMLFHWSWAKDIEVPEEKLFNRGFALRISNEQFDEYAQACKTFRQYGQVIMNMRKIDESVVNCSSKFLYHATHTLAPHGKVLVLVNIDVGTWKGVKSSGLPGVRDRSWKKRVVTKDNFFRVNDNGDLLDYTPETEKQIFTFKIKAKTPEEKLWSIADGKLLTASADGEYTVAIEPGGGTFIFLGTSDAYSKLRKSLKGNTK